MPAESSVSHPAAHFPVVIGHPLPIQKVVDLVAGEFNVPPSLIFSATRCRLSVARARQLAMYLSHVILGSSLTAVGIAFGRDRTTVSYACGLIEDMRDDPVFDAELTALEAQLQTCEG
ncbi:dnaA protein helix-turn-helix [Devosia lucknowensis]|uniref:DnaA protein helix-turn-helix n=1 Tax=Devosia lucknowensis TaxID=1096929 RepID=A0A1Y6EJ12_9HYPH|nr:helix-turn-helix domain-containing protein [Devosia lucknowensis]SMQ60940.1 dnaA protein helix-turn-helix [Devosia lucknowensis]